MTPFLIRSPIGFINFGSINKGFPDFHSRIWPDYEEDVVYFDAESNQYFRACLIIFLNQMAGSMT